MTDHPSFLTIRPRLRAGGKGTEGFTIIEMLTAMAVLSLVAVLILSIMSQTGQAVRTSSDRVESFQSARAGFDALTRQLGQATLNTYYDYFNSLRQPRTVANSSTFSPDKYGRQSDLHFISGNNLVPAWPAVSQAVFFQTPMGYAINGNYSGMENLLNTCGFFVAYTSDDSETPSSLGTEVREQYRFRLYRMSQPTERLSVYANPLAPRDWFQAPLAASAGNPAVARQNGIYPIADNVVAIAIWPKLPPAQEDYTATTNRLAYSYDYDSRTEWTSGNQPAQMHQLPPLVEVAMVTIDEASAKRLLDGVTDPNAALSALGASLAGKFQIATTAKIEEDLRALETSMAAKGVKCRIFRTTIPLRSSKWSNS